MEKKSKETFILRTSWYDGIKELPIEARGEILDAMFKLHIDGTIHQFNNPIASMLFSMIKESMIYSIEAYQLAVENGSKGGAPKGNNNAKKKQPTLDLKNNPPLNDKTTVPCFENNLTDTVIVTETESAIDNDFDNATVTGSDTGSVEEVDETKPVVEVTEENLKKLLQQSNLDKNLFQTVDGLFKNFQYEDKLPPMEKYDLLTIQQRKQIEDILNS